MNFAVLCDLSVNNLDFKTYSKAIESLDGSVSYVKFYGYNEKKNKDFSNYIKNNSIDICLPIQNRKKVRIDIRQVIDSIKIACLNKNIDGFLFFCAEIDATHMIQKLKSLGKKVCLASYGASSLEKIVDENIKLEREVALDMEKDFLPYSNVKNKRGLVNPIKEELSKLIEQKIKEKQEIKIDKNNDEIEKLIKKYF